MPDAENWIGGRYRLVRQLAAGGMGTVWEAYDERLHRPVAIKQLQLQPGLSPADAETAALRVMREAHLTARLHHPNAVQVYDVVDDDNHPCLVMQYVPSRSLQEIVRSEGPLEPIVAARIGTQVAAALAAAHRAGIVHRDVKPGNVLIGDDGTAKIADFGISHAVDDVTLTSTGLVTGTPAYLAPEVARGAESDFATDVYSLGATLYMAVEGHPPVGTDSNPMAVLHRVASGEVTPPQRSGPLTGMLATMMSLDPEQRPTMVEVANQLADVSIAPNHADNATRAIPRAAFAAPADAPAATAAYSASPPADAGQTLPPELSPRAATLGSNEPPLLPLADDSPPPARSRALWPVLVAAVLVIALGVVLGIVLLGNSGGGSANTAGTGLSNAPASPPATHHSQPPKSSPSTHSSAPKPTPRTSKPTPTPKTKSKSPSTHARPTPADLVNAVDNYYAVVPGNLNEGWNLLTPYFQRSKAQSRGTYDSYWSGIRRVDVSAAQARPPYSAVATLVYHKKDGSTSTERTLFRFVRQNGTLKINSTQVVG
ncbi:MAG TPA: protein kinase [Jatrophihabitans sp.]